MEKAGYGRFGRIAGARSGLRFFVLACLCAVSLRPQTVPKEASGSSDASQKARARDMPARTSQATSGPGNFANVTSQLGIDFKYLASHTSKKYLIETMGSGVALFDYDNDGRLDIFVVNGAPLNDPTAKGTVPQKTGSQYWNRLYRQKADGKFEDVTEKAGLQGVGYSMGVAVGDFDNDGWEDLYVTAYGGNKLYHNNGNGTFTDVTEKAGVAGGGW